MWVRIYHRTMRRIPRIDKMNANTIAQNKNWRDLTRKRKTRQPNVFFPTLDERFLGVLVTNLNSENFENLKWRIQYGY